MACRAEASPPYGPTILYDSRITSPALLSTADLLSSAQAEAATGALSATVKSLHQTLLQSHPRK
jgi:hypothetical protein